MGKALIDPERISDLPGWRDMLTVLDRDDWDHRVRISAGDRDGKRVGSVAQVPPVGIKLALRESLAERASAEIRALRAEAMVRRLLAMRALGFFISFCVGGALVGGVAALLRYGF